MIQAATRAGRRFFVPFVELVLLPLRVVKLAFKTFRPCNQESPKQCTLNLRFLCEVIFQLSIVASLHNGPPSCSSSNKTYSSSTMQLHLRPIAVVSVKLYGDVGVHCWHEVGANMCVRKLVSNWEIWCRSTNDVRREVEVLESRRWA
jgi:hypothetical protein